MAEEQYDEEAIDTAPPEQAVTTEVHAQDPKPALEVAGVSLNQSQLSQFIVLVASIVLMIALGANYNWNDVGVSSYEGYLISVAAIAMILSFSGLILNKVKEDVYDKVCKPMNLAVFLYSFIGACFLTFDAPFITTGNGYFASWALVYGSAMTLGMKANDLGSTVKGLGAALGLLASTVVVIIATITPIKNNRDKDEAIYALALACITFAFVFLALGMDKKGRGMPDVGYFGALAILSICWILEACIVTFRGPFDTTGNGYFASWAAAATCTMAAFAAKP